MIVRVARSVFVLACVAALAGPVLAETPIGGAIVTDQTLLLADSPFRITSDLTVQLNATLTIEAGVVVYVDPGVNIIVEAGALRALGEAGQRVVITSSSVVDTGTPAAGDWGTLLFLDGTDDAQTLLRETDVRFGQGISIQSASPALENVAIEWMAGAAIDIDLASFPTGSGNSASNCGLNAIRVASGEMTAQGDWSLTDIPYLVEGVVSIGAAPTITGVVPPNLVPDSTAAITIQGTRLDGATDVTFSGTLVSGPLTGGGSTTTNVLVTVDPQAAFGPRTFVVDAAAGLTTSGAVTLNIVAGTPILDQLSPASINAPAADTPITVGGSHFTPNSVIRVDGVDVATTFVSRSELTPVLPASVLELPGNLDITVATPDDVNAGQFLVSSSATFRVKPFGSGANGDLIVDGTTVVPNVAAALSGDVAAGATQVTATSVNGTAAGDEILIIQVQGTGVGTYEFARLASVAGDTATLTRALGAAYSSTGDNRAMVVRVPNYDNVSVINGGRLSANAWDGGGGLLVFRARTEVRIESGGRIDVSGLGFRGGARPGGTTSCGQAGGQQGESINGSGVFGDPAANDGGGGGGGPDACVDCDVDSPGGGGGYGTAGTAGINPGNPSTAGQGGLPYGVPELETELHLGSGGGESHYPGNPGGHGGGALMLYSPQLIINGGSVEIDGVDGSACPGGHPSGAGSGGSALIEADAVTTGDALTALGGTGHGVCECEGETGGSGGNGRIRILTNNLQGSTSPDPSVQLFGRGATILTLTPPAPGLLTQDSTNLTVSLDTPAPTGGQLVTLATSDPVIALPASVTVAEGATDAIFAVTSGLGTGSANVTASAPGFSAAMASVTVAARNVAVLIPPIPVDTTVTATINLSEPAPPGGVTFDISSAVTSVAMVSPATVTIAAGQQAGSFDVTGGSEVGYTAITVDGTAFGYVLSTQNVFVGEAAVAFNLIVAQPDLEVVIPGLAGTTALNVIVAQPDIDVVVPNVAGTTTLNVVVAEPRSLIIVVPGVGGAGDVQLNVIIAGPFGIIVFIEPVP